MKQSSLANNIEITTTESQHLVMGRNLAGLTICHRCIFDETVPGIIFDEDGVCNYCRTIDQLKEQYGTGTPKGEQTIKVLIDQIRADGHKKKI